MDKIYFTITGTKHRYGHEFAEKGMKVRLVKEPDNDYDKEAIKVEMDGLGHIGYVANNPYKPSHKLFERFNLTKIDTEESAFTKYMEILEAHFGAERVKELMKDPPVDTSTMEARKIDVYLLKATVGV